MHSLEGDLDIFRDEVFHLCDQLCHAREVDACDSFTLGLLESEQDFAYAQLSFVYGELELERDRAHTRLSTLGEELNFIHPELSSSQ